MRRAGGFCGKSCRGLPTRAVKTRGGGRAACAGQPDLSQPTPGPLWSGGLGAEAWGCFEWGGLGEGRRVEGGLGTRPGVGLNAASARKRFFSLVCFFPAGFYGGGAA